MAFKRQIKRRIEQRMAGADKRGRRLALWCDQRLLKSDALVAREHRLTRSDHAVPIAYRCGDVRHFIAAGLALASCASKVFECFDEERLDVVRLQASRFCAFHVLPNPSDSASVHHVVSKSTLFEQLLQVRPIDSVDDRLRESCAHIRAFAVTDRLN